MLFWQKSTYSGGGDGDHCIEVADVGGTTMVREGDAPDRVLAADRKVLAALIRHLKPEI